MKRYSIGYTAEEIAKMYNGYKNIKNNSVVKVPISGVSYYFPRESDELKDFLHTDGTLPCPVYDNEREGYVTGSLNKLISEYITKSTPTVSHTAILRMMLHKYKYAVYPIPKMLLKKDYQFSGNTYVDNSGYIPTPYTSLDLLNLTVVIMEAQDQGLLYKRFSQKLNNEFEKYKEAITYEYGKWYAKTQMSGTLNADITTLKTLKGNADISGEQEIVSANTPEIIANQSMQTTLDTYADKKTKMSYHKELMAFEMWAKLNNDFVKIVDDIARDMLVIWGY